MIWRIVNVACAVLILLWLMPKFMVTKIEPWEIGVRQSWRGRRVGCALVAALHAHMRGQGIRSVWVAANSEEAQAFYREAPKLNRFYADAHFYPAVTFEKMGLSQDAKPHWRAYQQLAPQGEWLELAKEFSE